MNPKTNVTRHSRKGTKGVRRHSRKVESPDAKRVPHNPERDEEVPNEEESPEDNPKDEKAEKSPSDIIFDIN